MGIAQEVEDNELLKLLGFTILLTESITTTVLACTSRVFDALMAWCRTAGDGSGESGA